METTYDYIVNLLLDHWFIAILVIIAIVIMALPQIRDGLKMLFPSSKKKKDDFIIEYADEKIICRRRLRTHDFDVVEIHATTHRLGLQAERSWIKKFYPDYTYNSQILSMIETEEGEKVFDIIPITNGTIKKDIYFEISDFFGGAAVLWTGNVQEYAEQKIKTLYVRDKKTN